MPKYVVSNTLKTADWANTTILAGDWIEAATRLKQDPDLDILMHGYGPFAKTLMRHGLLDQLLLWIHPTLAGVGASDDLLQSEGLNQRLTSGVIVLSYQPS